MGQGLAELQRRIALAPTKWRVKKIEIFWLLVIVMIFFVMIGKYLVNDLTFVRLERRYNDVALRAYTWYHGIPTSVAATPKGSATSIPVLLYHGILDSPDGSNVLYEQFRDQMMTLKREGWQTVSLKDYDLFKQGKKSLPAKSFLLTFDDGRKDSYYPVDPILKNLNYRAVMFLITKYSFQDQAHYYLSKPEVEEMLATGRWEVQAHARDSHNLISINAKGDKGHFFSNKMWLESENRLETEAEFAARITTELQVIKSDLEKTLRLEVVAFAYPFGDYGQITQNYPQAPTVVRDQAAKVYRYQAFQEWRGDTASQNYPGLDMEKMRRISVAPEWSGADLLSLMGNGAGKALPYGDNLEQNMGWIQSVGDMWMEEDTLFVTANTRSNNSLAYLDGGRSWSDYFVLAKVNLIRGSSFSLVARYQERGQFLSCDFKADGVLVEQRVGGGNDEILAIKSMKVNLDQKDILAGIRVLGNQVECLLDGKVVVTTDKISPIIKAGTVGFRAWDPRQSDSRLEVSELEVQPLR